MESKGGAAAKPKTAPTSDAVRELENDPPTPINQMCNLPIIIILLLGYC